MSATYVQRKIRWDSRKLTWRAFRRTWERFRQLAGQPITPAECRRIIMTLAAEVQTLKAEMTVLRTGALSNGLSSWPSAAGGPRKVGNPISSGVTRIEES
jgi:hypothetical protein